MATLQHVETRPPLWRDLRVLRALAQLVAVGLALFVGYVLWFNLTNNLKAVGIPTNFKFLTQPLGVGIAGSDLSSGAPIWRGLLVGVKNTLALVVVGLPLLTVIGVLVGVARLSSNWLVTKAATLYVELLRNVPPLLLILFAFNAVILRLPRLEDSVSPLGLFVINQRFIAVFSFRASPGIGVFWAVVSAAAVAAVAVWVWRTRLFDRTGTPHHRLAWAFGLVVAAGLAAFYVLGRPITMTRPVLEGRVLEGGFSGLGAYFAVLLALALYTASHVAEIVRGSVQAVPRGQTEAANALAMTGFQRLRYITLPQAMRIAIPPVISQYLNFTKNTSLAIAVGYAEVTRIAFQAIGNGQPAPQLIGALMAAYLVFSLVISFVVNLLNRRLQYVTR